MFGSSTDCCGDRLGTPRRSVRGLGAMLMAALTALSTSTAAAQPGQAPIDRLIADLDSTDFQVREAATAALEERDGLGLDEIEKLLRTRDLTPEQRTRLRSVARERFASTPRGAIGVSFGGVLQQSRIIIAKTYPGFPSHEVLQPGDMLVEADGLSLRGDMARVALRSLVFSHDPGDRIDMVIRRGAERKEVTITLGSYDVLAQQPGGRPLDQLDLTRAWAVRAERLKTASPGESAEDEPKVITCDLPADEWPQTGEFLQIRYKQATSRAYGGDAGTVELAAGGEPRTPPDLSDPAFQLGSMRRIGHPLEELTRQPRVLDYERELTILSAQESRLSGELSRLVAQLESRQLTPDQRAATKEVVEQFREALEMVRLERAAIEAEAAEQGAEDPDAEGG